MRRTALLTICLIALVHGAIYIVYLRPDWDTSWSDQAGYKQLGSVLARTGKFTRYPDSPVFVPEVLRTPGYPVFVAAVYRVSGIGNDIAVTTAQVVVFALLALVVFELARRVAGRRAAVLAASGTALFAPFAHFAALVLTELWTTFIATVAMLVVVRAVQRQRLRDFAIGGVLLSAATLVRPAFVLLPFFLAIAMPLLVRSQRSATALRGWGVLVISASLTLLPWFTYNYVNLGTFTLSPAGGIGRGLWEGSWQGIWPGRVQARLTAIAEDNADVESRVQAVATESGLDSALMRQYVREWRTIHDVWDTPQDPLERARARVAADQEYLHAAVNNMRRDPFGHVLRRMTRGTFVLWAAEIPIRYSDINRTPTTVIRVIWLLQVLLLLLAVVGFVTLARRGRWTEAVLLALPLIYVTGVHLPLLCEARQSLPVKPLVLVLAAVGAVTAKDWIQAKRSSVMATARPEAGQDKIS
jgi:4-amino-4-deoxy-L-arabinose transferase-like glycosyltransferase